MDKNPKSLSRILVSQEAIELMYPQEEPLQPSKALKSLNSH